MDESARDGLQERGLAKTELELGLCRYRPHEYERYKNINATIDAIWQALEEIKA